MKIITSNPNKQSEIKNAIANVKLPQDEISFINSELKEVVGNHIHIILYKAKEAEKITDDNFIIEDVTMYANNTFIPDIKWKQEELKEGDRVQLILTIAKKEDGLLKIYEKRLDGIIHLGKCDKYEFGFDNIFFVNNELPLGEYKEKNPLRNIYRQVITKSIFPDFVFNLNELGEWKGKYQNEIE